jgi:hypothetical protein
MKLIELTRGMFVKVGNQDFKNLSIHRWRAVKKKSGFYAARTGPRPMMDQIYLHREIMGNPVGKIVDHENRDTLDCRRSNLRICSKSQNAANLKGPYSNSKSGIRGVSWSKNAGKWFASIRVNGKGINIGVFKSKIMAAAAYRAANRKYFGMFGGVA